MKPAKKIKIMTTIKNTTGTKEVNIRSNDGGFRASYVQVYNGEQQVLQTKSFTTKSAAEKWAAKIL